MLVSACRRRAWELASEQTGVASVEYAVVLALFVVAALATIWVLGGNLASTFSLISDQAPDASGAGSHGPSGGTLEPVYRGGTHLPPPMPHP